MSKEETPEVENNEAVAVAEDPEAPEFDFAEDPVYDVDYKGDCLYEVGVKIPAVNKQKKSEEMLEELQHEAQLPGFRRGKAPRSLLEKKFSKAIKGDVAEKLIGEAFQKLIVDNELHPLGPPDFDGLEETLEKGDDADLEFTLKFEVAPRCTLGDYKGLEVEKPILKIEDKEVDETLETMRERYASYEPLKKGKSKEGDQAVISFKGTIDGEEFPGGAAENYPYILGSKRFFPEFEEALEGVKAGDEITCEVTFPDDYAGKDVAGKTAKFTIEVNEVKRKQLPEIDDDFANEAGFEDVADMREKMAEDLRSGAEQQSNNIAEQRLVQKIVENSTFELPESLVSDSAQEYYQQEIRRLVELRIAPKELEERDAEIRAEARKNAEDNIKAFVAINEVGAAEEVTVTEQDFESEAANIQQRTGMDLAVVQRFLSQADQRSEYETRIFRQKAMKVVLDHAKITEKEVARDELEKQDEDSDEA